MLTSNSAGSGGGVYQSSLNNCTVTGNSALMDAGGRITIAASDDGSDMVRIAIADTGRGIPPDALERVFEKFVQVHQEGEATPGSVGLGLAIAREVVQAHGGTIGVTSAVGEGSTFTFTLPQATEQARG